MSRYLLDTGIAQDFINHAMASGSEPMAFVTRDTGSASVLPC